MFGFMGDQRLLCEVPHFSLKLRAKFLGVCEGKQTITQMRVEYDLEFSLNKSTNLKI